MNKKLSFGLTLIFSGIVIFLATFNLFYIIVFIVKIICYGTSFVAFMGGIHEIIELIKHKKR